MLFRRADRQDATIVPFQIRLHLHPGHVGDPHRLSSAFTRQFEGATSKARVSSSARGFGKSTLSLRIAQAEEMITSGRATRSLLKSVPACSKSSRRLPSSISTAAASSSLSIAELE